LNMLWTIPKAKTKNMQIERATAHRVPLVGRAELIVRRCLILGVRYLFPHAAQGATEHPARPQKCLTQVTVGTSLPAAPYRTASSELTTDRPIPVTGRTPYDLRRKPHARSLER
jgi:hypothetical protein